MDNSAYKDINVFFGTTLINRGVKGFGFEVQNIPITWETRLVGILRRIIKWVYTSQKNRMVNRHPDDPPKLVWISRQQLIDRWLPPNDEVKINQNPGS